MRSLPNATLAFAVLANVHCSGESASMIGKFIIYLKFLSIHGDGCTAFQVLAGVLPQSFCANCELKVVTCF